MRPAGGTGLPAGIFPVSALPFDPYRASVRLSRGVYVPVRSRQGPFLAFRSAHDSRHLQVPVQRFLQNGRADESARADQGDCFHNFGRLTICILRTAVRRPVRSNANLLPKRTKTLRFRSVLSGVACGPLSGEAPSQALFCIGRICGTEAIPGAERLGTRRLFAESFFLSIFVSMYRCSGTKF